jgi:hypothetical protein
VDQGYTGQEAAEAAQEEGTRLEVVKLSEAKRGFVLLPKRPPAQAVGRGAQLRLGRPVQTAGQRL